jgi:hypothetical protein
LQGSARDEPRRHNTTVPVVLRIPVPVFPAGPPRPVSPPPHPPSAHPGSKLRSPLTGPPSPCRFVCGFWSGAWWAMSLQSTPSHVGLNANLPPCPRQSPYLAGFQRRLGDSAGPNRWLSPVKDLGRTGPEITISTSRCAALGSSQHVMSGATTPSSRPLFTCQESVVRPKPPEESVWFLVSSRRPSTGQFATPSPILQGYLLASATSMSYLEPMPKRAPRASGQGRYESHLADTYPLQFPQVLATGQQHGNH